MDLQQLLRKDMGSAIEWLEENKDKYVLIPLEEIIKLSSAEIQSGLTRVRNAEGLIVRLPKEDEGRNTWLLNYGTGAEAINIRERNNHRNLIWDEATNCLRPVTSQYAKEIYHD